MTLQILIELSGIAVALVLYGGVGARYVLARPSSNAWPTWVAGLAATGIIAVQAATSHAAAEPGWLPILANAVHWIGAAAWGGIALVLAVTPGATSEDNASIVETWARYSRVSLAGAAVVGLSGALLGFIHVHNPDALATTAYGAAYQLKLALAAGLLLVLVMHQAGLRAARDADSAAAGRYGTRLLRLVRIEALLIALLIVTTAVLATRTPPGLAPFVNPQTWTVPAGDRAFEIDVQPVAGQLGRVRLEIAPADGQPPLPEGTIVTLSMMTIDGAAGMRNLEALPIGPTEFLAETVLAMPGDWRLELLVEPPAANPIEVVHDITLPGPPLTQDMHAFLSVQTITYTPANTATFVTGVLLLFAAAWVFRLFRSGHAPAWLVPLSFINASLGVVLLLSVSFVKTYPSSFWVNPVPLNADAVRTGDLLYREHCADCHGLTGRGNGPWAVEHHGSIPDLTSPHMDTHTDGEIYWWIRYGIPSLEMPGYEDVLTDTENWTVINFMRSLRHGVPDEE